MKTKPILILALVAALYSCTQSKRPEIEGAWQLVYSSEISSDSSVTVYTDQTQFKDVKVWVDNSVMFCGWFNTDTSTYENYGYGTYTLDGTNYIESITQHRFKEYEGKNIKMLLEIKNDTLTQSWPLDELGQLPKEGYSVEKYIRVKY